MSNAYLDTHVIVWLYDGLIERLSEEAKRQIESNDLLISPMALLELQYLFDRKRIRIDPMSMCTYVQLTFSANLCSFPFPAIAREALGCGWTSDPFDRIIVANAKANREAVLITADSEIRKHYSAAKW